MKDHLRKSTDKSTNGNFLLFGVASLFWFIFRTGTKPSRIVYPCQRAALVNSSLLVSVFVPLSLSAALTWTRKFLSKKGIVLALLVIVASMVISSEEFWRNLQVAVAVDLNQNIQLTIEPRNATEFPASDIYAVSGDYAHMNNLMNLMSPHGLRFYKTPTNPEGLIAEDDIVIIKVNAQHVERGRSNSDLVREIVEAVLNHPSVFTGEIVIADNPQGVSYGGSSWDMMNPPSQNNAEDLGFSFQDIADMYPDVETLLWDGMQSSVSDFHQGDMSDGYVVFGTGELGGISLNYPKFTTSHGTHVSLKNGVWTGSTYEDRLKLINVPVLKTHGQYGVTASVKNYLGVISRALFNYPNTFPNGYHQRFISSPFTTYITAGICGLEMAQAKIPTLTILDAIWINPRPRNTGSHSYYSEAVLTETVLASTDPVALDYIASKYIILPTAEDLGYSNLNWVDPDYDGPWTLQGSLHYMLKNSMNFLNDAGYTATMNESRMNVYVYPNGELPEDTTPPNITGVHQTPPEYNVQPEDEVKVNATVSDALSGVKRVTLNYTHTNSSGTWQGVVNMTNLEGNVWNATIPAFPYGTNVTYVIIAEDNGGNISTTEEMGYEYEYHVIPEFPSFIIIWLFMITTLLAAIVYRRKLSEGARGAT